MATTSRLRSLATCQRKHTHQRILDVADRADYDLRDDVQELLTLVNQLRGFPSHNDKDVYGNDVKLDFNTFEIQWSNQDDDSSADVINEIAQEQKTTFKDVSDSIEALARTFAKKDSAV
jgi:hypothetical protein